MYEIVDINSKKLPSIIVITNDQIENDIYYKSPKKDLVGRLKREGYRRTVVFKPEHKYYKIDDKDYYLSWLMSVPLTTSIYIR